MYYFNDQIVMKIPHDDLSFAPHYDNYYGTNRDGKFQTVNLSVILNDFTHESGGFEVLVNDKWIDLTKQLKRGDVLAIEGNTVHRSHQNKSSEPRGLYACVFTEKPMGMKDFYEDKVND
jgi:ectoine hydroxylase-related dioxygenase (phytanoyl-CoA dioxygenase family)